jgi:hypothetical protein
MQSLEIGGYLLENYASYRFCRRNKHPCKTLVVMRKCFLEIEPVLFKEFVVKCFFFISLTGLLAVLFYLVFEMHPPQLAY